MRPVDPEAPGDSKPRVEPERSQSFAIMDLADKLRPGLARMFEGTHGDNNEPLRPSSIRGIALRLAEGLLEQRRAEVAARSGTDVESSGSNGEDPVEKVAEEVPRT
jgi:hypothetical protein